MGSIVLVEHPGNYEATTPRLTLCEVNNFYLVESKPNSWFFNVLLDAGLLQADKNIHKMVTLSNRTCKDKRSAKMPCNYKIPWHCSTSCNIVSN